MKYLGVVCLVVLMALGTGCKHKGTVLDTGNGTGVDGTGTGSGDGLNESMDQDRLLWNKESGLQKVYFDFDSSALRADAMAILQANAEKIKQAPGVPIQIEGHCDERGTQEYNVALGERRALAVRDYLIKLGISGDRLLTISYGEEMPADPGHNEAAWAKNRRCEFNKAM